MKYERNEHAKAVDDGAVTVDFEAIWEVLLLLISVVTVRDVILADGHFTALNLGTVTVTVWMERPSTCICEVDD